MTDLTNIKDDEEFLRYFYGRLDREIPFFRGREINRLLRLAGKEPDYHNI
jgi:hypothetical protein